MFVDTQKHGIGSTAGALSARGNAPQRFAGMMAEMQQRTMQRMLGRQRVVPPTSTAPHSSTREVSRQIDDSLIRLGKSSPQWKTAIHEAAHAAVALAVGMPVNSVSINPDAGTLGRMWFGKGAAPRDAIRVAIAGEMAEAIARGDDPLQHAAPRGSDSVLANNAAENFDQCDRLAIAKKAQRDNASFLRAKWPAIERVAARLMRDKYLDAAEVKELFS